MQSLEYLEESNYEFENHPARAVELLWSMTLFDISESNIVIIY